MSHKVLTLALLWISNSDLMAPGPIYRSGLIVSAGTPPSLYTSKLGN